MFSFIFLIAYEISILQKLKHSQSVLPFLFRLVVFRVNDNASEAGSEQEREL